MKGFIKLTAIDRSQVEEARATLLADADGKGHAAGVSIEAELENVSFTDRLTLMSAMGEALHFDKEDWGMLFLLKSGMGPLSEKQATVAVDKNTAKGRI